MSTERRLTDTSVQKTSGDGPYRVLVPVDDDIARALTQVRFVAALPDAAASVEATLTHVLHGEELTVPRILRSAQRVEAVTRAAEYLREREIPVEIRDADSPSPPEAIRALADSIDADAIVLGGRKHHPLRTALRGSVTQDVSRQTDRPVVVTGAARHPG